MARHRCISCSYDLSGLPRHKGGILCPECSKLNPSGPGWSVRRPRVFERAPFILGMLPPVAVLLLMARAHSEFERAAYLMVLALAAVASPLLVIWAYGWLERRNPKRAKRLPRTVYLRSIAMNIAIGAIGFVIVWLGFPVPG